MDEAPDIRYLDDERTLITVRVAEEGDELVARVVAAEMTLGNLEVLVELVAYSLSGYLDRACGIATLRNMRN